MEEYEKDMKLNKKKFDEKILQIQKENEEKVKLITKTT